MKKLYYSLISPLLFFFNSGILFGAGCSEIDQKHYGQGSLMMLVAVFLALLSLYFGHILVQLFVLDLKMAEGKEVEAPLDDLVRECLK
jgi:hypothetical protein